MARQAREISDTGVYHAILRGVNKQQIFECSEDYEHFIKVLKAVATGQSDIDEDGSAGTVPPTRRCAVYAYCLMGNHVHLLLKAISEPIGDIMKRIASSYVYYYNHKYDRIGHLFQERFKSQPVDNWEYFVTLLRYIHQNPLKPKLVKHLASYPWSSWPEYIGRSKDPLCSISLVLSRIPIGELAALINVMLNEEEEEGLIDIDVKRKGQMNDAEIWQMISDNCGANTSSEFQALPRPQQKHILYIAHEQGVGPRTLSRLTGVPYSIVQRATSAANERLMRAGLRDTGSPEDIEFETYFDASDYLKFPEY